MDGPRVLDDRRRLPLRSALGLLQLPPRAPELRILHRWLDTWSGIGLVVVRMRRQGFQISLGEHAAGQLRLWRSRPLFRLRGNQYCDSGQPRRTSTEGHQPPGQTRPGAPPASKTTCPADMPIKGNFTTTSGERCIYHRPGGEFYGRTKPERRYATEAEAEQDGCRPSTR